jgi:hypothetical protein
MRFTCATLFIVLLAASASVAGDVEKRILGKWVGTETKTAPDGTKKEVKLELEFKGSKVVIDYPELKIHLETTYRIEKDVLISVNMITKREQKRNITLSGDELTLRSTSAVMALKRAK